MPMAHRKDLPSMAYPFQRFAVEWAMRKGRAALFADCGLGKTMMQLAWADQIDGQVLLLTPLAVAEQTMREARRFGIDARTVASSDDVRDGINIANYEKLHRLEGSNFAGVVLDESSILKAMTGKISDQLIRQFREVPYRLACSATPAPNDYMEIGMHAEFLGICTRSEMLATYFVHDGGETQKWRLKGHAVDEFWRWVCSWAIAFRSPADIGFDQDGYELPPLTYRDVVVGSEFSRDGELFATGTLSLQERRSARKASLDARVDAAAQIANQTSEQVIVWCDLNAESTALTAAIDGALEVTGSMTPEDKAQRMMQFTDGEARVLVTKPSIAGFGMNWQQCSRMVFCGLSDSYEAMYQATRRCWRFGQVREVEAWIVSSDAEGAVVDNVRRKERDAQSMIDSMVRTMKDHGMDENERETKTESPSGDVMSGDGWAVHHADCVDMVRGLDSNSVGFSVFSPPFASLYTYTDSIRDMGNCRTHAEFYDHFRFLVRELYRVLMPGRSVSFHCMNLPTSKAMDGHIGIRDFRGELIRMFEAEGFIYHSEVCIWKNPVTAMQRTKALGLLHKTIRKDSSMSRQGIPDYLVTMRKPGENPVPISHTAEQYPVSYWQQVASPISRSFDEPSNSGRRLEISCCLHSPGSGLKAMYPSQWDGDSSDQNSSGATSSKHRETSRSRKMSGTSPPCSTIWRRRNEVSRVLRFRRCRRDPGRELRNRLRGLPGRMAERREPGASYRRAGRASRAARADARA
jgi:superfamily II DNA or RNA helicase